MSSKLLVNLVEPSDIVVPDTDGTTPDTGMFSISGNANDILSNNNIILVTAIIALVLLVASAVIILLVRHHKKHNLMHGFSSYTSMKLNAKRHLIPKLAGLSFIILVSVFGILKFNDNQRMANAETLEGPALTITTEEITAIDIEMDDEAVFGVGESKVKVTTATETGYTLMAYVDSKTTSLVNEDGDTIEMLETSQSQALTDNTWGISLSKPSSQEETLFRGLPTAEKDAMVVKVSGSSATEANDETTLYYAAYVTPDLDYGTYEGVTINYVAVAHVLDEDVTVNFHGNGYYFDEAGTKDVNTVVYGNACELAYVGGNCRKVYTTEQPYTIVKTSNLNDDGTQNGPYPLSYWDDEAEETVFSLDQSVTIPGADGIRVELKYGLSGYDVSDDIYMANNTNWDDYIDIYVEDDSTGERIYEFDGDTFIIELSAWDDEPIPGYDYGIYAKIYPIYNTRPENVEVVEKTVCYFAKSKNLEDNGDQIGPYYYDEGDDEWYYQTVTIPGAKKVKVEIEYAITDEAEIDVIEGYWEGSWDYWEEIFTYGDNIAGTNEYVIEGSTVAIEMAFWDEPVEGYNYGFYAKLYPIYDEETEDTVPEQICSFNIKSGEYSLPVGYPVDNWYKWYYVAGNDDNLYTDYDISFYDEVALVRFIRRNYDWFVGKTIDFYAYEYYHVDYDANGGLGSTIHQLVFPYTNNERVYSNEFIAPSGYRFIGWNTSSDGSGVWYYPNDPIYNLAPAGSGVTLYAQWEFVIDISDLTYMQDFATLSADEKNVVLQSMTLNQQYELKDIRDNKTYTIAKLADGNVWMTQNLDHDIVTTNNFYTYANTDIGHGSTPNTSATWTASTATYVANDTTWDNTTESSKSYDPGDLCWNGIIGEYTIATGATTCGNNKHYHIGNYYSWNAAIAVNDSSSYTTDAEDVDQSICPAGWRLPSFNPNEGLYSGKSYENLVADLNLTFGTSGNIQNAPVYFTYGGYWYGSPSGSLRSFGEVGRYWTSNAFTDHGVRAAFAFHFISSGSHGMVGDTRYSGNSVRCVAR